MCWQSYIARKTNTTGQIFWYVWHVHNQSHLRAPARLKCTLLTVLRRLSFHARKSGTFSFLQKSETVLRSRKDRFFWRSSLNAFVCFTLLTFSVVPSKQTLPLPVHENSCPSHEHTSLMQNLNRLSRGQEDKSVKHESKSSRTNL